MLHIFVTHCRGRFCNLSGDRLVQVCVCVCMREKKGKCDVYVCVRRRVCGGVEDIKVGAIMMSSVISCMVL